MINLFNIELELKLLILPLVYIAVGTLVYGFIKRIITRLANNSKKKITKAHQKQRVDTLMGLLCNIVKYIIVVIVLLIILRTYGIDITSILAGLGITTAIIGLAFQDLAKDLIAGFSIITEAQYEVGDTIEVDGFMGKVVFLGLKTTRIRDYKGATKIISNRNMDKIINYSLHNSVAVVDVGVSYEDDTDKVEKVLKKLSEDLDGKIPSAKGKMEILGINNLDDSSVVYRVTMEVAPTTHFEVERLLRKEIKRAFDEANIKIPYPQIEVYNGK